MTEPVVIGFGTCKWVKDVNTEMKTLMFPAGSGTLSCHDTATGANYQVPAGKKFIILNISTGQGRSNSATINSTAVYYGTTVDSTTGATKICDNISANSHYNFAAAVANGSTQAQNMPIYTEVAANNFITVVGTLSCSCVVLGIETNV